MPRFHYCTKHWLRFTVVVDGKMYEWRQCQKCGSKHKGTVPDEVWEEMKG